MALNFKPKTESELKRASLAPAGEYPFDVLEGSDETSKKSGNAMIKVKLGIYNGDCIGAHVYDYLMPAMEAKLRHFCDSTGLLAKYEAGTLCAQDCVGRSGRVKIAIEDKDPAYAPKNVVKDYVPRKAKAIGVAGAVPSGDDSDVPF